MAFNQLTLEEKEIIEKKGTEKPFLGKYDNFFEKGFLFVKNVMLPFFHPKVNLMPVAAGLLLTTNIQTR